MGDQSPYNDQFQAAVLALNNANGQMFQLHQTYDEVLRQLKRLPSDETLATVLATLSSITPCLEGQGLALILSRKRG